MVSVTLHLLGKVLKIDAVMPLIEIRLFMHELLLGSALCSVILLFGVFGMAFMHASILLCTHVCVCFSAWRSV